MQRTLLESLAAAKVITIFVPQRGISDGVNGIGDHERTVARTEVLAVSGHASSPLRGRSASLVNGGNEQSRYIGLHAEKRLSEVDSRALLVAQWLERPIAGNVGAYEPLCRQIANLLRPGFGRFAIYGLGTVLLAEAERGHYQDHSEQTSHKSGAHSHSCPP